MTQQEALTIMKTGGNVFLTGEPGAGKSYLTNQYIDWLIDNGKNFEVTASTGIAALNVGGKTVHSFAGLRDDEELSEEDIKDILGSSYTYRRYSQTDILIIDEVSMVSAQLFQNIDTLAQIARNNKKPFGGMKLVVVGDFYQLPPVKGDYCFKSKAWTDASFTVCNITEQHRTNDMVFTSLLKNIRTGLWTDEQKQILRDRVQEDVSHIKDATRLDTHNKKVDDINNMKLSRLDTIPKTYNMTSRGNEKAIAGLKKSCLSPEMLILKPGAKVLFTKNDIQQRWVNGTQGEVESLKENSVVVRIYKNNQTVEVGFEDWEQASGYGKNKTVHAVISQIPLRLAWAITIHKSQGMTLDSAIIDVSNAFATGQVYVAISRVRSLDGLYLQGKLSNKALEIDESVKEFYESI